MCSALNPAIEASEGVLGLIAQAAKQLSDAQAGRLQADAKGRAVPALQDDSAKVPFPF